MINTSMSGLERRLLEPDFAAPASHVEAEVQADAEASEAFAAQPALDRLRRMPLPEYGRVAPATRGARRSIGPAIEAERVTREDERAPGRGRTPIAQAVASLPAAAAPAAATAPSASASELGMVDLMLADPLNRELVAAWGGSGKLPDTDLARDQIARFGNERAEQMQQLARATATVRDEYQRAVDAAASQPPPPPAFNPLNPHDADIGDVPSGWSVVLVDVSEGTPNYRTTFSTDAYTAWYAKQDSLAGRAFAALYGEAKTTVEVGENYERSTTTIAGGLFTVHTGAWFTTDESGTSHAWQPGRLEASGGVVPISLSTGRELHDRSAVWFDPALGFVTARENIVEQQDWLDKAAPIIVTGAIMVATSGAGGLFSVAGGSGTIMGAVTTATGSSVLGAAALGAAGGALAATVNGAFSGHLSLKDVFRSALTGAVTGGVMQAAGLNTLGLDQAGKVVSYAQRAMAISGASTLQGALTALSGGRFADGFKNGLTAGIAQGLASEVMHGMRADIAVRVKSGQLSAVDASALRTLTQATGSAIRALGNPDDPGFAFAAEFVGTLVDDGVQGLQERGQGEAQATFDDPHAAFRASERDYRSATEGSVAGTSHRARPGDSISRIVGSSDPQAIGNFMRANNLTSDHIEVGRNYFVPADLTAYPDSVGMGQHALNVGNDRSTDRNEAQRELNRSVSMAEASRSESVWTFREASMAQRRLDDARELQLLQERLAIVPQHYMSATDHVANARAAIAQQRTANDLAGAIGGPFVAMPMLAARGAGLDEFEVEQAGILGFSALDAIGLRSGIGGATRLASGPRRVPGAGSSSGTGSLDWSRVSPRTGGDAAEHVVLNHGSMSLTKPNQGVFYGNPVATIDDAWSIAQQSGLKPVTVGNRDIYVVPRPNSGYAGGMSGQLENLDHVTIIAERGTSRAVTGYPSGATPPLPKGYDFLLGNP